MAPKKLTDCPENLRESIDWLIQVRYGNGSGGQGLEELAKALKRLIGEAIEKADESLKKRQEQLECPEKYYANPVQSYCTKKQSDIDNETDESKKSMLKKEKDDHYKEVHYLTEDARQGALSAVTANSASLSVLREKLDTFTNSLTNNHVLTHLCSGLETFLGYESGSYTGEGIVYSDLDRLCDGVMSFLHGVLHSIQPKLGLHKESIKDAINALNTHKHSGKEGFNAAISAVVKGVREYNNKVRESNKKVSGQIHSFQRKMKDLNEQVSGILPEKKAEETIPPKPVEPYSSKDVRQGEENIKKKLEECKNNAKEFSEALNIKINKAKIKEAIEDLNPQLRDSVMNAVKAVQHESKRLKELSEREAKELKETEEKIGEVIKQLEKDVNSKIDGKVRELVEHLKGKVSEILKDLEKISKNLETYTLALHKWIEQVHNVITAADEKVTEIVEKDNIGRGNQEVIKEIVANQLIQWRNKIGNYICNVKDYADELNAKVKELAKQFPKIVGSGSDAPTNIDGIFDNIRNTVAQINGKSKNPLYLGFEGIKEAVKEYAEGFTQGKFEDKVKEWIKEILENNDLVKGWIQGYVEKRSGMFTSPYGQDGSLQNEKAPKDIAQQIVTQLQDQLNGVQERIGSVERDSSPNERMQGYVKAVQGVCNHFADQLHTKLSSTGVEEFVKGIAGQIDSAFELQSSLASGTNPKDYLTSAVRCTVEQLVALSRQVAAELESFAVERRPVASDNGIARKIEDAHTKAQKLHDQLHTATGQPKSSSGKTNHAEKLDQAINTITKQASELDGRETLQKLTDFSTDITEHLKKLLNAFADKGADVRERLGDLAKRISKDTPNIDDTLRKIKDDLSQLQASLLTGPIKKAREFLQKDAADAEKHFTKELKKQVDKNIEDAETDLIVHARKQYVDAIKDLLTKFAEKVTSELDPLPAEIKYDLTIGHKGFMKKMSTHYIPKFWNADGNKPRETTPAEMTATFNAALNYFLQELKAQTDFNSHYSHISSPVKAVTKLFNDLSYAKHFDHTFTKNLSELNRKLGKCTPKLFGDKYSVLLDPFKEGLNGLAKELGNAYISTYDGVTFYQLLSDKVDAQTQAPEKELTDEGRNCAKVCLTILYTFYNQLYSLFYHCYADWSTQTIQGEKHDDELRKFLERQGYDVVQLNKDKSGREVGAFLTTAFASHKEFEKSQLTKKTLTAYLDTFRDPTGPVSQLFDYLNTYYSVCHLPIPASKKHPSSIYDMLTWLTGLTHNPVHHELTLNGFADLFEKPKDKAPEAQSDDPIVLDQDDDALEAYPKKITATGLSGTLAEVSHYSYETLVAILGNGHAGGIYACEFNINPQGFLYPSNMNTLICTLYDILQRVYEQCYFLYQMCTHDTTLSGWKECWYGRGVGGSSWKCNNLQCANQTADQRCDQHPICGVKSPLQSFLEDGLQGFLPHTVTSSNGKLNCPVKGHFNLPCKTPMGFADITNVASHRQKGHYLRDILRDFCGKSSSLTALLSHLRCVLPSAPKTLGDMFGFYFSLLADWDGKGSNHVQRNKHREAAYRDAVQNANFRNPDTDLELTSMFSSSSHGSGKNTPHHDGDLYSLVNCTYKRTNDPAHPCGSYIKPLCRDICGMFAEKHAESFYDLLKQLYETCNSKCGKKETKCYVKSCANGCAKKQSNGKPNGIIHDASCSSIVSCKTMLPTLYSYGFVFDDTDALNGNGKTSTKRTCADLCRTLERICHGKSVLANIVINKIPEFLFRIREPFIWTLLALWSLSLLYLLHIAVVRLDVLRIRSHIKSPASHRIAAQSLLAAARVKALANVKYFSP
ncbi:hypothetical protein, conserved [Babesia ovata]|uniref:C3H1-type domain-containing protein n=1 Tax=Babesia ovata TaxID=189622 RepID=A0A2H6K988_9APIC|nr:uncharacterized protein BOVATA_010440 [Babesia ovata]GBE59551.1 hypothetical protein, conserved [Babesia ovata]